MTASLQATTAVGEASFQINSLPFCIPKSRCKPHTRLPKMASSMQLLESMQIRKNDDFAHAIGQKDRVRDSFPYSVNKRIDDEAQGRIQSAISRGPNGIQRQLSELDHEWDIDRALMANFAILGGVSLAASILKSRRWFYLLATQMTFLLYHAVKGWCPPASVFRRLGFRTQKEIQAEQHLLMNALNDASALAGKREAA